MYYLKICKISLRLSTVPDDTLMDYPKMPRHIEVCSICNQSSSNFSKVFRRPEIDNQFMCTDCHDIIINDVFNPVDPRIGEIEHLIEYNTNEREEYFSVTPDHLFDDE